MCYIGTVGSSEVFCNAFVHDENVDLEHFSSDMVIGKFLFAYSRKQGGADFEFFDQCVPPRVVEGMVPGQRPKHGREYRGVHAERSTARRRTTGAGSCNVCSSRVLFMSTSDLKIVCVGVGVGGGWAWVCAGVGVGGGVVCACVPVSAYAHAFMCASVCAVKCDL